MIDFTNMIEQLQTYYLNRYKCVHAQIYQISQFDEPSTVSTSYLGKVDMTREEALSHKINFHLQTSPQQ